MKKAVQNFSIFLFCIGFLPFFTPLFAQTWTQQGVDIDGEASLDGSGQSVSISSDGTTVAIGAPANDGSGFNAGHVRVYKLINGVWTQQGADINGEAANDQSGNSVALSSDGLTVAIGAPYNDGTGTDAGHVRVYKLISGVWTQQGADIDGEAADDRSGYSVSLSSDGLTVAISAILNDGLAFNSGHVRVYKLISGVWTQQGADIDGEGASDQFGYSVALSSDGQTLAVGARYNLNIGHARVFKFIGGVWTQQGADIDGEGLGDQFGNSVALSSNGLTVAIGATKNDGIGTDAGHVRVFKLIGNVWIQQGTDIDGEAAGDLSGTSVSLSSDGLTVAIGADSNDGTATNAGHVRVYKFISGTWTQQGIDIDGEAANDQSGISVSLSSDGTKVAIGAYRNDGNGSNTGQVRVYELIIPLPVELLSFTGKNNEIGNLLTWETASENQNKGFDIERSVDGSRFEKIGFVQGAGTTTKRQDYRFLDPVLNVQSETTFYYRLKQLDKDGRFEYSKAIVIAQSGKKAISIFPNPSNGAFTILGLEDFDNEQLIVLNNIGQILPIQLTSNNQLDLSAYPAGLYFLRVASSGQVIKLIKE